MVDPSMVVFDPHAIVPFACRGAQMVEMGLILPNAGTAPQKATVLSSLDDDVVRVFTKRKLFEDAVSAQDLLTASPAALRGISIVPLSAELHQKRFTAEKHLGSKLAGAQRTTLNAEDPAGNTIY